MPDTIRSGFVEAEGARLYFEVAGQGHPLILIHAGVADSRMWDDQFDTLATQYRVIRYDLRGHGRSRAEDVTFSHHQDLYDILRHLGVEHTYLCGVSAGGALAIDFALEHPETVDAIIPVASGLSGYAGGHQQTEVEKRLFEEYQKASEHQDFARLADLAVEVWVDGPGQLPNRVDPRIRKRVGEMSANNFSVRPVGWKPQPLDPPAIGRLSAIRVSTLIIVGDLDVSGIQAIGNLLEQGIRGARKIVVLGTAHMLTMEKPGEFNRIATEFLNSL